MAGGTGDGDGHALSFRFVGVVAGRAGGEFFGLVGGKGRLGVELLFVAGAADLILGLDKMRREIRAVAVMAQATLALGHLWVGLVDNLTVVFVALVAELSLGGRQQGCVGVLVEAGVTVHTAPLGIGCVREFEAARFWQVFVTGHTLFLCDLGRRGSGVVGLVALAALQVLGLGMGGEALGGIDLVLVAGTAQLRLGKAQDGWLVGAVGKVTEVTFALGNAGVRLRYRLAILVVAVLTQLCDRLEQELGVGAGVGEVAVQAIALRERLVLEGDWRSRVGHLFPMALAAHLCRRSP